MNIHFTRGHERDLDLIAAAGFKFIRMDFSWGGTERTKGQYQWGDYEELMAGLEKRELSAIFILDYSNRLYEEGNASPQHPESVAAFARWAGAAAKHFKGRSIIWEIWNEPNIHFWKPKPDVQQYITLAQATCKAVRGNDPAATIVAPASSEFPWEFLETMFKAGLLEQLDGVSVHPYRNYQRGPETATEDYVRLRALIERYAPADKKAMPILSGEWGYASHSKGVSLEKQAAFIVRQQLANLLNRAPVSIWYDWKNDGTSPDEIEHNFGTVYPDLKPKPAYETISTMTRQLSGYRIAHRLDAGSSEIYVLLLTNSEGDQKLAAWHTSGEQEVELDVGLDAASAVALVDGKGQSQQVKLRAGRLQLGLSPLPQYVALKERSRPLAAAAAWEIYEPFSRSVLAGSKDGLALRISVRNPFPKPVTVHAGVAGPEVDVRNSVKVGVGQSVELPIDARIDRRDAPSLRLALAVEYRDVDGNVINRMTEPLLLHIANPLELSLAPVAGGLRVTVEDKAGSAFRGYLEHGQRKQSIALTAKAPVAVVQLSQAESAGAAAAEAFVLRSRDGRVVVRVPSAKFELLPATNCAAKLDGDAKVAASASIERTAAPDANAPYPTAFKLDYQFGEGWRFVRCETTPFRFTGRPAAVGVWVYGDGSGNALRLRVRDASGQTFQPTGPNLDWMGWRWVRFDLRDPGSAGHWGGANDGVVHGELTLDTALLVDSTGPKKAGTIWFSGLAVVE